MTENQATGEKSDAEGKTSKVIEGTLRNGKNLIQFGIVYGFLLVAIYCCGFAGVFPSGLSLSDTTFVLMLTLYFCVVGIVCAAMAAFALAPITMLANKREKGPILWRMYRSKRLRKLGFKERKKLKANAQKGSSWIMNFLISLGYTHLIRTKKRKEDIAQKNGYDLLAMILTLTSALLLPMIGALSIAIYSDHPITCPADSAFKPSGNEWLANLTCLYYKAHVFGIAIQWPVFWLLAIITAMAFLYVIGRVLVRVGILGSLTYLLLALIWAIMGTALFWRLGAKFTYSLLMPGLILLFFFDLLIAAFDRRSPSNKLQDRRLGAAYVAAFFFFIFLAYVPELRQRMMEAAFGGVGIYTPRATIEIDSENYATLRGRAILAGTPLFACKADASNKILVGNVRVWWHGVGEKSFVELLTPKDDKNGFSDQLRRRIDLASKSMRIVSTGNTVCASTITDRQPNSNEKIHKINGSKHDDLYLWLQQHFPIITDRGVAINRIGIDEYQVKEINKKSARSSLPLRKPESAANVLCEPRFLKLILQPNTPDPSLYFTVRDKATNLTTNKLDSVDSQDIPNYTFQVSEAYVTTGETLSSYCASLTGRSLH